MLGIAGCCRAGTAHRVQSPHPASVQQPPVTTTTTTTGLPRSPTPHSRAAAAVRVSAALL